MCRLVSFFFFDALQNEFARFAAAQAATDSKHAGLELAIRIADEKNERK